MPKRRRTSAAVYLTKGDYADFHIVLKGLEVENEDRGGLKSDEYIQYPIKLERWLMEGSYDRVWEATKREGVPSEEYGVFSEVSITRDFPCWTARLDQSYWTLQSQDRLLYFCRLWNLMET